MIGFPKAGTQGVTAFLDAHPEIDCFPSLPSTHSGIGEGHFFCMLHNICRGDKQQSGRALEKLRTTYFGYFQDLAPLFGNIKNDEFLERCKKRYEKWCDLQRTKKIVGEKSPDYVWYLDEVDQLFPDIKKVCIVRDPKDVIVSYFSHKVRQIERKGKQSTKVLDDEFVREQTARIKKGYEALANYSGSMHCMRYEDAFSKPKEVLRKLLVYLNVSASDAVVQEMVEAGNMKRLKQFESYLRPQRLYHIERRISRELFPVFGRKAAALTYWLGRRYYLLQKKWFTVRYNCGWVSGVTDSSQSHFRKGVRGDWQNHLTKEQADYIDGEMSALEREVFKKYGLVKASDRESFVRGA